MNNYEMTTDEYCTEYKRYKKRFSWKAFKRFGYVKGQILTEKYDIILVDYRTRNEKIMDGLRKINMKNIDRGITAFNRNIDKFTRATASNKRRKPRVF